MKHILYWILKRLVIYSLAGYVIVCLAVTGCINQMMFHPQPTRLSWKDADVINIGTEQSPISAVLKTNAASKRVILFSYGNAEETGDVRDLLGEFANAGISAMGYDYPGYGLTTGKPTEKGVYRTAEAAYRFLTETRHYKPEDIIVMGRSLGSGPACYLAEKYPVGGLIVLSGFTSAPRVVTRVRVLPVDPFPNISRMRTISCPKLFLHGTSDSVIPFSHGEALYARASAPKQKLWVEGADHNDFIFVMGEQRFMQAIVDFCGGLEGK